MQYQLYHRIEHTMIYDIIVISQDRTYNAISPISQNRTYNAISFISQDITYKM